MFEKILECTQCSKRFHYEHEGHSFPNFITCPECKAIGRASEYHALVFCTACRSKIAAPLEMLYAPELRCPRCGENLSPDDTEQHDSFGSTIAGGTAAAPKERKSLLQPGEFFDKYRIIELLGKGGMAEVYLAEHLLLKQKCALKLMLQYLDQDDPVFIKRFLREAKLTHSLNHPNIVKVFDAGSDFNSGCLYIAMEYVEGCTLGRLIEENDLTEGELLGVLDAMCMALKGLEEARIVHRDIKPSNIMLTMDGIYKLMDLGIAKSDARAAGEMTLTMDRTCIGTPGYASPEQCQSAHKVDIRSDIFSLGATIYHAATGVIPFDGDTPVAVILKVLQEEPVPIEEYRSDLSPQFVALIKKMMAKDPKDRPGSVDELQKLVFAVSSGNKIVSGKKFMVPRQWKDKAYKAAGAWTEKSVDTALAFLVKDVKNFLRPAFAVFLIALLGVNLYYIYAALTHDNYLSYKAFLSKILTGEKPVAPPPIRDVRDNSEMLQDKISRYHPLFNYPDELGDAAGRSYGNGTPRFPQIFYTSEIKGYNRFTFDTVPPSSNLTAAQLQNGVLSLPSVLKKGELDNPSNYRYNLLLARIFPVKDGWMPGKDFSFSINLRLKEKETKIPLNICRVEIMYAQGKLYFFLPNGHFFEKRIDIPVGKWFNLTFSLDAAKGRFLILSGDRLLGAFLYSGAGGASPSIWFSHPGGQTFSGEIDCITLSRASWDVTLRKGNTAPMLFSDQRLADDFPREYFKPAPKTELPKAAGGVQTPSELKSPDDPGGGRG